MCFLKFLQILYYENQRFISSFKLKCDNFTGYHKIYAFVNYFSYNLTDKTRKSKWFRIKQRNSISTSLKDKKSLSANDKIRLGCCYEVLKPNNLNDSFLESAKIGYGRTNNDVWLQCQYSICYNHPRKKPQNIWWNKYCKTRCIYFGLFIAEENNGYDAQNLLCKYPSHVFTNSKFSMYLKLFYEKKVVLLIKIKALLAF